jgi:inosine-uridine nucleoside N-ribohydrolase
MTDGLPVSRRCRVIVDNDYQGDPDGLTNIASALRDASDIASRFTLIWIGGSLDGSAFEYNRDTDPAAAAFVLGQPSACTSASG